jgi:hypothetical protein
MKYYNKFYEIGNNAYYTLTADDDLFLATESFIEVGKKNIFGKRKRLTQGLKLLNISTPIAILLNNINELKPKKGQKDVEEDMLKYPIKSSRDIKNEIESMYTQAMELQIEELKEWKKTALKENKDEKTIELIKNRYKDALEVIKKDNPMNNVYDFKDPFHTEGTIIKSLINNGAGHLYSERVTAFAKNVYLFEQDCFGTITIYRIMTIKNVVKNIDTFILDKKLISEFLRTTYEKWI